MGFFRKKNPRNLEVEDINGKLQGNELRCMEIHEGISKIEEKTWTSKGLI